MDVITAKQERFCQEYIVDLNATQALIRAGYSKRGANATSAGLLVKSNIASRIEVLKAERAERLGVTQDMVVKELAVMAFTSLTDVVDITKTKARIKGPLEVDPVKLRAISELTEITNGNKVTKRIKMSDKKGCLELLGRHLGMFNDKLSLPIKGEVIHKIERVIVDGPKSIPREASSDARLPS